MIRSPGSFSFPSHVTRRRHLSPKQTMRAMLKIPQPPTRAALASSELRQSGRLALPQHPQLHRFRVASTSHGFESSGAKSCILSPHGGYVSEADAEPGVLNRLATHVEAADVGDGWLEFGDKTASKWAGRRFDTQWGSTSRPRNGKGKGDTFCQRFRSTVGPARHHQQPKPGWEARTGQRVASWVQCCVIVTSRSSFFWNSKVTETESAERRDRSL